MPLLFLRSIRLVQYHTEKNFHECLSEFFQFLTVDGRIRSTVQESISSGIENIFMPLLGRQAELESDLIAVGCA